MANVASLTSKRGGHRGAVTRLITKISDIVADAAMDRDRKIHELNNKFGDLYNKIKVVETLDTEIVELLVLIGFTSCRGVSDIYNVLQLSLIDSQGSPILIEAIAIPHIVDPISDPYRTDLLKLPHLKNLLLAHPVSKKVAGEKKPNEKGPYQKGPYQKGPYQKGPPFLKNKSGPFSPSKRSFFSLSTKIN
ncbi:hypothetical protein GHT06_020438 [Daphnia sinensis]|uniref:Uncharacterized protein n=1 Tax=Daphnia sinensis TaxID=1820382 RepID=A0AAD5KJ24_9CRUS|nr:hypothetical protein GHT06_020438 [Daphnia sinensis]